MKTLPFAKIIPGGNATILLPASAAPRAQLPAIAQQLMGENHIEAEQVGSLAFGSSSALPHLQMMGGEFCVNATRACATLLANAGRLMTDERGCTTGHMSVSGSPEPILVATAPTAELLSATVTGLQEQEGKALAANGSHQHTLSDQGRQSPPHLPKDFQVPSASATNWVENIPTPRLYAGARLTCPLRSEDAGNSQEPDIFHQLPHGLTLVHLPGISHLLIPVKNKNFPSNAECEALTAHYRAQYSLERLPAMGAIWYSSENDDSPNNIATFSIFPAVYVKATDSLCLETACGSASLALALHTCISSGLYHEQPRADYAIVQPSGETLTVVIAKQTNDLCHAWVTGPAHIVALGTAFI